MLVVVLAVVICLKKTTGPSTEACCTIRPSLGLLPGPLDHGLWGAVEENELGIEVLLQIQLTSLAHQEDVCAKLEDAVNIGQLFKHNGVVDATEELAYKLPNDEHHRGIQTHDPEGMVEERVVV